ncbi:MAG: YkvA family protein [Microvirga sp.]
MSGAFSKRFTKAEMDTMRREGRGGPDEGEAARDRPAGEAVGEEATVRRSFWSKLRRVGGRIPFAEDLVAAYYCAVDPATPNRVRLILMGAIAYFILPTDAIADFLPLVGFADDAAVLATAITQVASSITETHRTKARDALLQDG